MGIVTDNKYHISETMLMYKVEKGITESIVKF